MNCNELVKVIFAINELQLYNIDQKQVERKTKMKTYKGIIFDLDGTLLDTINDLTDSVNDVMKIYGWKEYDSKACKMMVGNGFRKLIQSCLLYTSPSPRDCS